MDFREALHPAANIPDFARELAARGFDKASELYETAKKNDPGFKLPEKDVNRWGYDLLGAGKVQKAIAVFQLNVTMYPESSNVYDSLGEAQETSGDPKAAVASYRKSLQLNPGNRHALARLKELEGSAK